MTRAALTRLLLLASAVALVLAVSAPLLSQEARAADPVLVAAAKKEGEVVWYTTLIVDMAVRPVSAAFEKTYGIKVRFTRANSTETAIKVINEAKAGRVSVDVLDGTNTSEVLRREGLVLPYLPESARGYPKDLVDPNGYWIATNVYVITPAFNTELVKPGMEPRTFDDLLDPKWRGKMVWNGSVSTSGGPGFIGNVLAAMGDDKGMAYLRKLAGQRVANLNVSARQVLDQVIAGEYEIGLQMFHNQAALSAAKGAPAAWIPMEPTMGILQVASIARDAPHPNAAKLFLDFLMSKEGQTLIGQGGSLPANPDVPWFDQNLRPEVAGFRVAYFSPTEIEEKMPAWKTVFDDLFR
ncbi:MAG TPA: extracellular solute-binding protein [Alphaproteobacteria bacterium]|nr:extracellular solute-binding protein [Alphaproteobacteria bacterium]